MKKSVHKKYIPNHTHRHAYMRGWPASLSRGNSSQRVMLNAYAVMWDLATQSGPMR